MSHTHPNEYEFEPVPGLPEELPKGERMLWQGAPDWQSVARRVFHVPMVAIYFGVLIAWRIAAGLHDGLGLADVLSSCSWLVVIGSIAVALLSGLAWATSRTTLYTMTDKRIVMRYGIALPMALNLPFSKIDGASVRRHGDGTGDVPLQVAPGNRIAYLALWPHARPWRLMRTEPTLRAIPRADEVAKLLGEALAASATAAAGGTTQARLRPLAEPAPDTSAPQGSGIAAPI